MHDEIINVSDIYIQSIICDAVSKNVKADAYTIYNNIVSMLNIEQLDDVNRILQLIELNKSIFIAT